jgi:hypothetical protein
MAGHHLTGASAAGADPVGAVAAYLATLDRHLPGPRRQRADIGAEIADGLLAAADRHRSCGAAPAAAVRAALAEFGPPEVVAAAFAGELAAVRARRLLTGLLLTGPAVGVWWLLLLAPGWPPRPAELVAAIPVLPIVGATIAGAVAVLAASGRWAHRLPAPSPRRTVWAAQVCAVACLAVDVVLLTQLALLAVTAPAAHPPALMAAAAAASLIRLPWVGLAAGRCRRSTSAVS